MSEGTVAVTHYCERVGMGFWAEPVNAVTNASFIVAAVASAVLIARRAERPLAVWDLWLLVALMAAIGVGSFLWHTLATPWSEAADVIPILLFISVYLLSFLVRVGQLRWYAVVGWFLLFELINFGTPFVLPVGLLNGSIGYAPTWLGMIVLAAYARARAHPSAGPLMLAVAVFTLSLVFRTVDREVCDAFAMGTHWGWHLLNGVVLYLACRALPPLTPRSAPA